MSQASSSSGGAPGGSAGGSRLVIVALVVALVAVIVVNLYIEQIKRQVEAESFTIYRLNRPVQPGDVFRADYVDSVRWPRSLEGSVEGFVRDDGPRALAGDPIMRHAEQGDFLLNNLFLAPVADEYRQPRQGFRFVKLSINARNVPGNLRPEMIVDILAPFAAGGGQLRVLPVMEAVRVIAVGTRTAEYDASSRGRARPITTSYQNITIEVTPDEAMQLSRIEKAATGDFELLLRNSGDDGHPYIPSGGINPQVLELVEQIQRSTAPQAQME